MKTNNNIQLVSFLFVLAALVIANLFLYSAAKLGEGWEQRQDQVFALTLTKAHHADEERFDQQVREERLAIKNGHAVEVIP